MVLCCPVTYSSGFTMKLWPFRELFHNKIKDIYKLFSRPFGMNKPELYNAANELQRKAVLECLKEYSHKIKWNNSDDTAIDLGCGDGSVSVITKNFAPCGFKKFVATDINEAMINFATKRYEDENIIFRVIDMEKDLPDDLKEEFNHVFSFYAFHWVKDQEKGFRNVYNLMSEEGDCFIVFLATTSVYSIYAALAQRPKWKSLLKNVDAFISPYHTTTNPEKIVAKIMDKCGFKNIDVVCKKLTNVFDSVQKLKNIVKSVEPFDMPTEIFDDLMQDFLTVGQEIGVFNINKNDTGEVTSISYDLALLCIYGSK